MGQVITRPVAQRIQWASSATGQSTGYAQFGEGMGIATVRVNHPSTKIIGWNAEVMLGPIASNTGAPWQTIISASSSTADGVKNTTSTGIVFDKVRINITSNETTGNVTTTWWVLAR